MERKVSLSIYAGAFAISLVIFITGIFIGYTLDTSNLESISGDVQSISQKVDSLQLLLLLEGNSSSFCPVYTSELDSIDEDVELVGHRLSFMEEKKQAFDIELKRQYFVLQAKSYLLSKKVKEACGDDSMLLINFYSNTDCDDCVQQGSDILKSRDDLQGQIKVKLYSFDGEIGSPVADAFKDQYEVTTYPTLVIDEKTYSGYHSTDEIKEILRG